MEASILDAVLPSAGVIALSVILLVVVLAVIERLHSGHWPSARRVADVAARLIPWCRRSQERRKKRPKQQKRQRPAAPDKATDRDGREV